MLYTIIPPARLGGYGIYSVANASGLHGPTRARSAGLVAMCYYTGRVKPRFTRPLEGMKNHTEKYKLI